MRGRTLILFIIAVMLAGGTAMLVRSWLSQHAAEVNAAPLPRPVAPPQSILVARAEISRGQILKPGDLIWQAWHDGQINQAYIREGTKALDAFAGWVARASFGPGEPITEAKIVAPGSRGFLAAALQPGMRAISVPVSKTSDVSGFVLPGDQVDILITHSLPSSEHDAGSPQHQAAETVLQDVRVLAVDQKLESKAGEPVVAQSVTLEVTPKESEMIAVAAEIGKLWLSLRSLPSAPIELGAADSSGTGDSSTFTLDSEVSKLLTHKDNGTTILRGNSKSG